MFFLDNKIGETPLETLQLFRQGNPEYEDVRLSYAGRLDPMAAGKLLILEGEENDHRDDFLGCDKRYDFQILFGASTDTFDLLGVVDEIKLDNLPQTKEDIQTTLNGFMGSWEMSYPPYSAKTVDSGGKKIPLWQLARADKLPDKLPTKTVEIYKLNSSDQQLVSADYIIDYIINYINRVSGDFRQEEIIDRWKNILEDNQEFLLVDCAVSCSSSTYVRRLAHEVGRKLKCPALALSITRTSINLPEQ